MIYLKKFIVAEGGECRAYGQRGNRQECQKDGSGTVSIEGHSDLTAASRLKFD
jgi:hypothetical protein